MYKLKLGSNKSEIIEGNKINEIKDENNESYSCSLFQ